MDLRDPTLAATAVIGALGLAPHPEGGHYRELWRDPALPRGAASTITFLLAEGERSHWHRVDADEIWVWQGGAAAMLEIAVAGEAVRRMVLGPDPSAGQVQQGVVPRGAWQAAHGVGAWSLFACIVAPAFDFAGFELAPPGWTPPGWAPESPITG